MPQDHSSPLNYLTATASHLQELLREGKVTSEDLVLSYLARIEKDNTSGFQIRGIIEVAPRDDLLEQARALDLERRNESTRGPLHGIPIVLKDNIATQGNLRTVSGSLAIRNAIVPRDVCLVEKLKEAGMIVLAKSNLSEWCNCRACGTLPNGWSAAGGQGLLPFNMEADTSGSSSGSAAAIAAGFSPLAIGTETDGSLICPASRCGIFSLKPTVGLVSRSGVVPISVTQDSPGPMAKSMRDLALLLDVIAGADESDEASISVGASREPEYTAFLQDDFAGLRFGVLNPEFFLAKEQLPSGNGTVIREAVLGAIRKMEEAGAVVLDSVSIDTLQEMRDFDPGSVQNYEFKYGIEAYLSTLEGTDIRTLADLIQFNEEHPELEAPEGTDKVDQETFIACEKLTPDDEPAHDEALARQIRLSRTEGIDAVLQKYDVNVLIVPSESSKATRFAAMAGYAIATAPLGVDDHGVPFGLSFLSGQLEEGILLRALSAFEKLYPHQHLPALFRADACQPTINIR